MDAVDRLIAELPQLADWPRGDLDDMLHSTSPTMSPENAKIQRRYWRLVRTGS